MTTSPEPLRLVDSTADGRLDHDPTPEQIRILCWQIQEGWDQTTRRVRAGVPNEVSVARLADV